MISKIYVVCPANVKSGGPELLHQLVYTLNKLKFDAQIAYYCYEKKKELNISYPEYVERFICVNDIDDDSNSIIVLPETRIDLSRHFTRSHICIWWMSVDNFFSVYSFRKQLISKNLKKIFQYIKQRRWRWSISNVKSYNYYNLAQSQYAMNFLHENNLKRIYYLSDYINPYYLQANNDEMERKNVVLYNPKKGFEFTKKIIEFDKNITWIPLINLSRNEVRQLLFTSKVYIDFGNHPGKDRFPREAVMCGCCLITGLSGAAKNIIDIPIPSEYKFENDEKEIPNIISRIHYCFNHYEETQRIFENYKKVIVNEQNEFIENVNDIFTKIQKGIE